MAKINYHALFMDYIDDGKKMAVLRICKMPEVTVRLSTRGLPGLPRGRCGSIAAQALSDSQNR